MGTSLYFFWHRLLVIGQVLETIWETTKLIGLLEAMWEIVSGTLLHLLAAAAAIDALRLIDLRDSDA